jgi:hypothetical protein
MDIANILDHEISELDNLFIQLDNLHMYYLEDIISEEEFNTSREYLQSRIVSIRPSGHLRVI